MHGRGWSTPVVWGDKVFFTSAVLEDPSLQWEEREGKERRLVNPSDAEYSWEICCLDADSGKELWKRIAYEGNPIVEVGDVLVLFEEEKIIDKI